MLRLLEEVGELDLSGELGVERIHDALRPGHLLPLVAAEGLQVDHAEGVRLGEHVHVAEVSAKLGVGSIKERVSYARFS